jgi:hypothetical protein
MILNVHVPGAHPYDVGDEIWQEPLEDAIRAEAETIAGYAGSELLESPDQSHRDALRDQVIAEMTRALVGVGDTYRAPDGVLYSLTDRDGDERAAKATDTPSASPSPGRAVIIPAMAPTVVAVLRFESLPVDERGSRRAVVRWSDGSTGEALRWYEDEILITEGDLINKTAAELRTLHFRRDREFLQD